jgi:hypothetical protein
MAAVVLVVIAFLVGGFLVRKRKPTPEPQGPRCPYCKGPAHLVSNIVEC